MKNHINKMTYKSLEEVQELFESSFGWLHCALGRMGKLVAIEAPVSILRSELKSWDTKIGLVRDILSDGRIELNAKGKDGWREMLVEYLGFSELRERLDAMEAEQAKGMEELERELRESGLLK